MDPSYVLLTKYVKLIRFKKFNVLLPNILLGCMISPIPIDYNCSTLTLFKKEGRDIALFICGNFLRVLFRNFLTQLYVLFLIVECRCRSFIVSHVNLGRQGTLAFNSFRWHSTRIFNRLSIHIRNISACSIDRFKSQLAQVS